MLTNQEIKTIIEGLNFGKGYLEMEIQTHADKMPNFQQILKLQIAEYNRIIEKLQMQQNEE
jgi:hypothetical protein